MRGSKWVVTGAVLVALTTAGCSDGHDAHSSRPTETVNPTVALVNFTCPESSDTAWPETDQPKARDTLLPATPATGVECRYRGPAFAAALVGPTTGLSAEEIGGLVTTFNRAPELTLQRCPNSADPITFTKYHFQYPDGSVVVIEKGRYTCPPSISNGQRQRGYPTR